MSTTTGRAAIKRTCISYDVSDPPAASGAGLRDPVRRTSDRRPLPSKEHSDATIPDPTQHDDHRACDPRPPSPPTSRPACRRARGVSPPQRLPGGLQLRQQQDSAIRREHRRLRRSDRSRECRQPNSPTCLVFGPDHDLYVTDRLFKTSQQNVLQYNGTSGAFQVVFASQNLDSPRGLVFGPDGDLYVVDGGLSADGSGASVDRFDGKTGAFLKKFVAPAAAGSLTLDSRSSGPTATSTSVMCTPAPNPALRRRHRGAPPTRGTPAPSSSLSRRRAGRPAGDGLRPRWRPLCRQRQLLHQRQRPGIQRG